jgi:hypothetical protein
MGPYNDRNPESKSKMMMKMKILKRRYSQNQIKDVKDMEPFKDFFGTIQENETDSE